MQEPAKYPKDGSPVLTPNGPATIVIKYPGYKGMCHVMMNRDGEQDHFEWSEVTLGNPKDFDTVRLWDRPVKHPRGGMPVMTPSGAATFKHEDCEVSALCSVLLDVDGSLECFAWNEVTIDTIYLDEIDFGYDFDKAYVKEEAPVVTKPQKKTPKAPSPKSALTRVNSTTFKWGGEGWKASLKIDVGDLQGADVNALTILALESALTALKG